MEKMGKKVSWPTMLVLILIIMEDTHGEQQIGLTIIRTIYVLILIIMEDTHGESRHISP